MSTAELRFNRTASFQQWQERKNRGIWNYVGLNNYLFHRTWTIFACCRTVGYESTLCLLSMPQQMQIPKAVSTSDIFVKPWCAFAQGSMTTVWSCKTDCSLSAKIPNSAPCKPGFYKNHPQGVFPCGIIDKYICFRRMVWMLNFRLFLLSLIPQNLWLKSQRSPMHPHKDPLYSHAVLQSIGSISYNYRWEYVCRSNKWMDVGAILSRSLKLLRNKICINFCFDGNWNFYLQ